MSALNVIPDDLWSHEQLYPLEKNFSDLEMDHSQVLALMSGEPQSYLPDLSHIDQAETKALLSEAIGQLSSRQQQVLRLRFSDENLNYDQVAKRLDISKEKVRQIEQHALRRLRHPNKARIYTDCLDEDDYQRVLRDEQRYLRPGEDDSEITNSILEVLKKLKVVALEKLAEQIKIDLPSLGSCQEASGQNRLAPDHPFPVVRTHRTSGRPPRPQGIPLRRG